MRNHQGFSPLLAAAQYGQTDICGLLLSHGSNVNEVFSETNWTALHFASVSGHYATVEALLLWGAVVDPRDHAGMTPLYGACQEGHMACVLILLKAGAIVSVEANDGSLPIHTAARLNRVEIIGALLEHGCRIDSLIIYLQQ